MRSREPFRFRSLCSIPSWSLCAFRWLFALSDYEKTVVDYLNVNAGVIRVVLAYESFRAFACSVNPDYHVVLKIHFVPFRCCYY